jgi:histidinol-phosphate aminotransferase
MQEKNIQLQELVRKNILNLKPYSSARDEFQGVADVYLDANENPYPSPYNRYPDPLQRQVKEKLATVKKIPAANIFLGNGSDEAIDLLIRAFCEPYQDEILITDPTYGMYAVCADINAVAIRKVKLTSGFDLDLDAVQKNINTKTKLIFLCSPNNPTGNLLGADKILSLLQGFKGLVVVDEAYIDFTGSDGFAPMLSSFPNLVILQTFSKAWGLAGLRLGMCFASVEIISILNKIKYPYNVSVRTQEIALEALSEEQKKNHWVDEILRERDSLKASLLKLKTVYKVFPSDANFILVQVADAPAAYQYLMDKGIIVRDRSKVSLCENCLRITIGTPSENQKLLTTLSEL